MQHRLKKLLLSIAAIVLIPGACSALPPSNLQVLVNKEHPVRPIMFRPNDLVVPNVPLSYPPTNQEMQLSAPAAYALQAMFADAAQNDIHLMLASGYRSYETQDHLYALNLALYGQSATESVAYPGFSEHQTGLAADVRLANNFCNGRGCFTISKAANWLVHNSYKYGYILRYPLHKESITGYEYEPWHFRYVGQKLANTLYSQNQTLDEYYPD